VGRRGGYAISVNNLLSSPQVVSEHVNGILVKGRWFWLKCIPCVLSEDPESMKQIIKLTVIDVAVILHNFLIQEALNKDKSFFFQQEQAAAERGEEDAHHDNNIDSVLPPNNVPNRAINKDAPLGQWREQLRAYLSKEGHI
jgi:hypothetical protein